MSLDLDRRRSAGEAPGRLANLRDVSTASPLLVAGVLLRSDAPHSADSAVQQLASWPPRTVVDLRDHAEKRERHPYASYARIVDLPLLEGAANGTAGLGRLYLGMLQPPTAGRLVEFVTTVARAEGPVLVHCSAGKDRTGVAIAVTLRLLGIDRDSIVADYTRTSAAMPAVLSRLPLTTRYRAEAPALADQPVGLLGAPAEAMVGLLDGLDAFGGVEAWLLENGGDAETIADLRARLLLT